MPDLRRLLALCSMAALAGGCTALNPLVAPSAHQCPWIDVHPSQLQGPERQELRARVTATGVDYAFTVAVERSPDSLILVGLTPLGTKSFEVERRGKRARVANHLGIVSTIPPRNVLADVTGMMLPSPCDTASAGEATAEHGRWRITDTCVDGRVSRRHVQGPGTVGNVDIRYEGNETLVLQHDCGYEARYISVGDGAAGATAAQSSRSDAAPAPAPRAGAQPTRSSSQEPQPEPPSRPATPQPPEEPLVSSQTVDGTADAEPPVAVAAQRAELPRPAEPPVAAAAQRAELPRPAEPPVAVAAQRAESPRPAEPPVAAVAQRAEPPRATNEPPVAAATVTPMVTPVVTPSVTPSVLAIVGDLDRSDADLALDAGRQPDRLLAFLAVEPGMRVAELGAGGGYTAELLARAVGNTGTVYAQNNKLILDKFARKPWSERLAKPVMRKVVRVDREFSDPLPTEARDLDLVVMNLFYHDTVWMKADRDAMNRAIFRALRPGGRFVVIDHSARAGRGIQDVQTLHRIEESVVGQELGRAGFRLSRQADFLRNPSDERDWNDSPSVAGERRGSSDRFVLEFLRPH